MAGVVALFVVAVLNVLSGLVIVLRQPGRRINWHFFLLTFGVAGWGAGVAMYFLSSDSAVAHSYANLYYTAALLIGAATLAFSLAQAPSAKIPPIVSSLLYFVAPGFLLVTTLNPNFLTEFGDTPRDVTLNMPAYILYSVLFLGMFLTGVWRLTVDSFSRRGKDMTIVSVSIAAAGVVGVLFNLLLPGVGNYSMIWVGPLASLIFVIALMYSVLRYQLFDIRTAFARAVAYIASVVVLGALFGILVVVVVTLLGLRESDFRVVLVVATIIVTVLYPPTKLFFDKVTKTIFYQGLYDIQQAIDEITGVMVQAETLKQLLERTSAELKRFTGASSVTITLTTRSAAQRVMYSTLPKQLEVGLPVLTQAHMLASKQKILIEERLGEERQNLKEELREAGIAMVGQLRSPTELVGYILFSYKQNGTSYTMHDQEFVDIVSDEFSIAIQNMQRFQEITQFNSELQQKITDATAELRVSNQKLHELDKSKDEFISMASHQLRTPLTSVKGYISMVLEGDMGEITDKQRDVLEQAYDSSQRMVYLIGDFLNVSRLQTGKFELERSPTNLAELIQEEIEQLTETARNAHVKLVYDKPSNLTDADVDGNKIRQVMMNLIDNAIYYTRPETSVTVTLHQTADEVVFRVTDQGIGVPVSEQHQLFTKFFRASNAKRKRPDGTGIGLYMAKKVVVAHGGSIIFETIEGQGSTFGFKLPLKKPADSDQQETPQQ